MPTSSTDAPVGAPAPAPTPLPPAARSEGLATWRAVEYAVVPGFRPLLLDVVRPDSAAELPLVVFLHGGGWRVGSRSAMGPMFAGWAPSPFAELATAGFAVASLDYRLSGEAAFPAPLRRLNAALKRTFQGCFFPGRREPATFAFRNPMTRQEILDLYFMDARSKLIQCLGQISPHR